MESPVIYALSDSIGETAEAVARAVASQFDTDILEIVRIPYIHSVKQLENVVADAAKQPSIICHTIVSPDLRQALNEQSGAAGIMAFDIMGPMIQATQAISGLTPKLTPGLIHKLDQEYFRRVEAVEFAVKYDDGKNSGGLLKADIVIVGVSRTSKTPLSMYLAHKKWKVANVPLVPEIPPPHELFQIPSARIIGLVIDPYKLNEIRAERLKVMGLAPDASYAAISRIEEELAFAKVIMEKLNCPVIDVSNKAIEETANQILDLITEKAV